MTPRSLQRLRPSALRLLYLPDTIGTLYRLATLSPNNLWIQLPFLDLAGTDYGLTRARACCLLGS